MSNTSDTNLPSPEQDRFSAIVDRLDPDLAAAYRSGNSAIIQAVNNGMTTSEMIVKELIRTGVSMVGLPPGVQILVNERQKEMDAQREAENARLKALGAGVFAAAMSGSNIAEGSMYYGEGKGNQASNSNAYYMTNPPSSDDFRSWDEKRRMEYLEAVSSMSTQQWGEELKKEDRHQHLENAKAENERKMDEAGKALVAALDQMKNDGLTPQEIEMVQGTLSGDPATPEGKAAMRESREKLAKSHPYLAKYVDAYQAPVIAVYEGAHGRNDAYDGQKANDNDDHDGSKKKFKTSLDRAKESTAVLKDAPTFASCSARPEGAPAATITEADDAKVKALIESDAALSDASKLLKKGAGQPNAAELESVRKDNIGARTKHADASVKQAALTETLTVADEFGDAPAAAPRLTINAQPLASVGMLAPEGVAVANDAKPAAPEREKPRVSSPGQGMG